MFQTILIFFFPDMGHICAFQGVLVPLDAEWNMGITVRHEGCTGELVDKSATALLVVIDLEDVKSPWVFHFNPLGGSIIFLTV